MTNTMHTLYRIDFKAMGSICEIVIADRDEQAALSKMQLAHREVLRIEQKYSRYREDSVITQINASAGKHWVECDEETQALLNYADQLYTLSNGLFDITSGVLRSVWNFKKQTLPDVVEIEQIKKLIGWKKVLRDGTKVKLQDAGMELDLGGFGKEYAVDQVANLLVANGVESGLVNLGGDVRVLGPKPDGSNWFVAVQNPRDPEAMIANVPVERGAVATSGDYESFMEVDGKRYCHILSPFTGTPVSYWRSVSVMAPLALTAGTFTTIAMLKEADAIDWLKQSGFPFFAVDADGKVYQHN